MEVSVGPPLTRRSSFAISACRGAWDVELRFPPGTGHRVLCRVGGRLTIAHAGFVGCSVVECRM
jgi:hypothetical protein